jgi:peptide/nickel transport system substrate-binding protein
LRRLLIPVVSVLLVLAFIISGCSSSTTTNPPATTQAPAVTTKAPAATTAAPAATTAAPVKTTQPPTTTAAPAQKRGGIMRFLSATGPTTPGGWPAEMSMDSSPAYEALISQQKDGKMNPNLALSWEIAQDRSSVTFKLRQGVKFTDGSDFNAAVVKFMYDAQIASKKATNWTSVEIVDPYTVKINVKKWTATTMAGFSDMGNTSAMVSKAAYEKNGVDWLRQNPTGTSAFMFKSFTRDDSYKSVRNPNYWQTGKPYIDELDSLVVTDAMTQKAAMQNGDGDAVMCEMGKQAADYQKMGMQVASQVQAITCIIPDTGNPDSPWAKQAVREAAEYAIDKDAIATAFGYGMWQAPYQIIARGYGPYDNNFTGGRKYDPAKAKAKLAEAGLPNGFKTTMYPFPGSNTDLCQAVQKYLSNVGITVDIQYSGDYGKYATIRDGGWSNGFFLDPVPGYANYMQCLSFLFNHQGWIWYKSWARTPDFITAFDTANNTLDADNALIQKLTGMMYNQATVIPISEGGMSYAYQSYVKDAGFLTRGMPLFWHAETVWLDK